MRTEYIHQIGPRSNQEDYIVVPTSDSRVFVLCDGMGGHGHGEIASKIVGDSIYEFLSAITNDITHDDLQKAVDVSLDRLKQADIFDDAKKMGTTLVVVVFNRNNILVGHIGDSRCYIFDKDFRIKFRSRDHSLVQEAIDEEILTEEEAFEDPKRNVITRCITSGTDKVKIDVDDFNDVAEGDTILICSDGIHDTLRDADLAHLLSAEGMVGVESYCKFNARDNFSAILLSGLSTFSSSAAAIEPESTVESGQAIGEKPFEQIEQNSIGNRHPRIKDFLYGAGIGLVVGATAVLLWDYFNPDLPEVRYVDVHRYYRAPLHDNNTGSYFTVPYNQPYNFGKPADIYSSGTDSINVEQ